MPDRTQVQEQNIPPELKALDRWVVWNWQEKKNKPGEFTKPPLQVNGRNAASNNPKHWTSYDKAIEAYNEQGFSGIGVVLPEGMVGIDLDDCINGGELSQTAKMIQAMCPTYCEISPSGNGLKMIAAGSLNCNLKSKVQGSGADIELYDGTTQYFTITGSVFEGRSKITGQREGIHALQTMINGAKVDPPKQSADNYAKAIELLDHIDAKNADTYHDWLSVGMALHWCDDRLFAEWDQWSRKSDSYCEGDCESKWESFKSEGSNLVTIRHLERLAKESGYNPDKFCPPLVGLAELLSKPIEREYIIDEILTLNEPMVVGGASKSLKTSISLDMAFSIATGTPFLGEFAVLKPRRVVFFSGESGEATTAETLREIAIERNVSSEDVDKLLVGFKLPKLDDPQIVSDMLELIERHGADVVFIDPLYRSLRAGNDAGNVYAMGEKLEWISEKIHRAGVTPILLHHFRKQGKNRDSPELEDLSQSGIAEFARQFLLLKRREEYVSDGRHNLWMRWGGSAGHQGLKMLEVYTGTRTLGLTWQTTIRSPEGWEEAKKAEKELQGDEEMDNLKQKVLEVIGANPGINIRGVREEIGGKNSRIQAVLEELEMGMSIHLKPGPRNSKLLYLNEMSGSL